MFFSGLRFMSCVFTFNKLLLTQEHILIESANHLPLKFSERTKHFLKRQYEGKLALQNIFFLVSHLNRIEV